MFRTALEAFGDIVFMTDPDGVFTFVNRRFSEVYGYDADEVVGRATPRVLKSGVQPPGFYAALWTDLTRGRSHRTTLVNRTKAGQLVTVQAVASAVDGGEGTRGFLAIQRDITAEVAARRQAELAYAAVEHAPDAVFYFEPDGHILYANPAATRLSGYAAEELRQLTIRDLDGMQTTPWTEAWRDLALEGTQQVQTTLRHAHGHQVPVDVRVAFVRDGREHCACAIVRDVSEVRRLQHQLLQAQKMEAIGRLAGGIAHDFNNVLTAISGYGTLLMSQLSDPSQIDDLQEILSAADRAAGLTAQLLAFGRTRPMNPSVLDLSDAAQHLAKLLQQLVGEDIRIDIGRATDVPPVCVDPTQFDQVLFNLAANARDAMPGGGTLTIRVEARSVTTLDLRDGLGAPGPGDYVSVAVQDTGTGIDPAVRDHLFEPFVTTKPPGKGTGLGLATVFGVMQQNEGFVTVESDAGRGTTVTLFFPVFQGLSWDVDEHHELLLPPAETGRTILLAEDERTIRRIVERLLRRRGFTVLTGGDVNEVLHLAATHEGPIDLVLTDVVMPDMRGPELVDAVRKYHPSAKVVYMSGYVASDTLPRDAAFLAKPFTPDALFARLSAALGQGGAPRSGA